MGNEKLSAAEAAAEKQRRADLSASIERMDDVELKLFAQQLGVADADKLAGRKELIDEIETKADADAVASRQRLRDMEDDQGRFVAEEDGKRPARAKIIRALNAEFCSDVPQEARAGGAEFDKDHPRFGGDYNVPDGRYRVTGSEWLFDIKGKKLVAASRATEANKYGGKDVKAVE